MAQRLEIEPDYLSMEPENGWIAGGKVQVRGSLVLHHPE
jgi:hypothetical protein